MKVMAFNGSPRKQWKTAALLVDMGVRFAGGVESAEGGQPFA